MTERQAKRLAKAAMPCPFCGEFLVPKNDEYGFWVAHADELRRCIVSVIQLIDDEDLSQWNTREDVEHILASQ
jgi:hypothetical protein